MILTFTPNPGLDYLIFIDEFRPGVRIQAEEAHYSLGGKGVDASVALRTFEVDTLALSFVAGAAGQRYLSLLDSYGIRHDMVWVEGETRVIHVVVERRYQRHTHLITSTLPISESAVADLMGRYKNHLRQADWVVAAGTLAPGWPVTLYPELIALAQAAHVPILVDSSGLPLLQAIPARPTVLKMNDAEFADTFQTNVTSLSDLYSQARALREREKLPALVITCGKDGILALTPNGDYLAAAPVQPAANAAGAGDTASGILAWRLGLGESWPEALRWAAAASAASVLTEGTADSRREDVERLWPQVTIQAFNKAT
ncbi:MAG: hexose kinase [Anaerolineae bacterium]